MGKMEDRQKPADEQETILDLLGMPAAAGVEFEPPRLESALFRPEFYEDEEVQGRISIGVSQSKVQVPPLHHCYAMTSVGMTSL